MLEYFVRPHVCFGRQGRRFELGSYFWGGSVFFKMEFCWGVGGWGWFYFNVLGGLFFI